MEKRYTALSEEDLKKVDAYAQNLMDTGLNSVTVNNHGRNTVTFDGRSRTIKNAVETIERELKIKLTPEECVYYPNMCSHHNTLEELLPDSLGAISAINQQNEFTNKYCMSSGCTKCPQYAENGKKI